MEIAAMVLLESLPDEVANLLVLSWTRCQKGLSEATEAEVDLL